MTALDARAPSATVADPRDPVARLERLLDQGSATVLGSAVGTEVVVAAGLVEGIPVVAYCSDSTTMAGALGATGAGQVVRAIELVVRRRCPVIGLWHSGGAKLADGVESMDGVGRMFAAMTRASGVVPQVSVILGPAAGAAAYGPALTDVAVLSTGRGRLFVTGPDVVPLGHRRGDRPGGSGRRGSPRQAVGVAHLLADSEDDAIRTGREVTALLASPGSVDMALLGEEEDLRLLLPDSPRRAYDVHPLLTRLVDGGRFHEFQPKWARNVVVGLGRLAGCSVGVVANNPLRKGGCLDSLSAEKASRFVRMCDSLGVPLVVVVDVPGYLPGVRQEWEGVVRRGAKLLHAFAEAVVPRVTLITRKAYGGAYIAMNSRSLGATAVFAWPEAEAAVMGAEAAARTSDQPCWPGWSPSRSGPREA
jgi:acetyl-CoA/propionyl-CoA carboxylase carboxyl transferase subunit